MKKRLIAILVILIVIMMVGVSCSLKLNDMKKTTSTQDSSSVSVQASSSASSKSSSSASKQSTKSPAVTIGPISISTTNGQGELQQYAEDTVKKKLGRTNVKFSWDYSEYEFYDKWKSGMHAGCWMYRVKGNFTDGGVTRSFVVDLDISSTSFYVVSCSIS